MTDQPTDYGLALRRIRELRKLSLRDLSKLSGVNFSVISRMENGHIDTTGYGNVTAVLRALEISMDDLGHMNIKQCPTCGGNGWVISKELDT